MPTAGSSAMAAAVRYRGTPMPEDDHLDNATAANSALGRVVQVEQAGQGQARFSIARVTPETASSFLAMKRASGRRNQTAVAAYALAMRTGEWVLNGMPIILSRNGVLLDGLQRLYACIEAKTPFVTVLAENVPDDTIHTIDQQRRRSFTGVLETRGIPHPAAVASLLAKLIRYDDETLTRGTSTPPWSRMERALEANRSGDRHRGQVQFRPPCAAALRIDPDAAVFHGTAGRSRGDPAFPGHYRSPGTVRCG